MDLAMILGVALLLVGVSGAAFNTFLLPRLGPGIQRQSLALQLAFLTDLMLALLGLVILALPEAREVAKGIMASPPVE